MIEKKFINSTPQNDEPESVVKLQKEFLSSVSVLSAQLSLLEEMKLSFSLRSKKKMCYSIVDGVAYFYTDEASKAFKDQFDLLGIKIIPLMVKNSSITGSEGEEEGEHRIEGNTNPLEAVIVGNKVKIMELEGNPDISMGFGPGEKPFFLMQESTFADKTTLSSEIIKVTVAA